MSSRMNVVIICDVLGITYEEYVRSPRWFIDLMYGKRSKDNEHQKASVKTKN